MRIPVTLARVALLHQQLHEAIVEEHRNELNQRSNTMKKTKSMMSMVVASIHICTTCGAEHHGAKPDTCAYDCGCTEFKSVSSLSEANKVTIEVLAAKNMVIDGTTGNTREASF